MIRNETEYREAVARVVEEAKRIAGYADKFKNEGLSKDEIKRAIDPLESFHAQLVEEVESYERLKRGELCELHNIRGLGHMLISLRIARNMTQKELAESLGVHVSQVSRDERNEYHGITIERVAKIVEAMGADVDIKVRLSKEPVAA